jgi:hypothetical protein
LVPNGPIAENFLLCIPLSSPFSPTPPNTVLHNLSTIPSSRRSQRLSTTPLLQCSAVPFPALAWFFLHRCRLPLQRIWLGASSIIPNTTGASDLRRESTRVLDHHSTRTSDFPPSLQRRRGQRIPRLSLIMVRIAQSHPPCGRT